MCENVVSACGSSRLARYLANKRIGDSMALTKGLSGASGFWNFGSIALDK